MSRYRTLRRFRRRLRDDDDVAAGFDEFVADAGDSLFRLAVMLSTDVPAGEDLYQETLQRVASRWATIDNPTAWSRRVMHNLSVDRFRAARSRPVEVDSSDVAGHGAPDQGVASGLEAVEVRADLLKALSDLSAIQRLVVALRFLEDRSEAEVAELIEVPVGTVKSTTSRALDRLRRHPSLAHLFPSRAHPGNEATA